MTLLCLCKLLSVLFYSGGISFLESFGENDELFVQSGMGSSEVAEMPDRRKHSLPQQLDSAGVRQVS